MEKYGEEQVQIWRRSYDVQPPPMPVGYLHSHQQAHRHGSSMHRRANTNAHDLALVLLCFYHRHKD